MTVQTDLQKDWESKSRVAKRETREKRDQVSVVVPEEQGNGFLEEAEAAEDETLVADLEVVVKVGDRGRSPSRKLANRPLGREAVFGALQHFRRMLPF